MTNKFLVWGLLLPLIGLVFGILTTMWLKRFPQNNWRFFDFLPPFLTVATNLVSSSLKIADTWAYTLIAVCLAAIIYAIYEAVTSRAIQLRHYFRMVWRFYLIIAVFWYLFIIFWTLMH